MPRSNGANSGGPMTMLKTGIRQPPGLRATPRTWKTNPRTPSASSKAHAAGITVRATRRLVTPHKQAAQAMPLSAGGLYMIF